MLVLLQTESGRFEFTLALALALALALTLLPRKGFASKVPWKMSPRVKRGVRAVGPSCLGRARHQIPRRLAPWNDAVEARPFAKREDQLFLRCILYTDVADRFPPGPAQGRVRLRPAILGYAGPAEGRFRYNDWPIARRSLKDKVNNVLKSSEKLAGSSLDNEEVSHHYHI